MNFLSLFSKHCKGKNHYNELDEIQIKSLLNNEHDMEVFDEIHSTNLYLKECDKSLKEHFTIVVSDSQTNGIGRVNRRFFSPKGRGIYFSILLYPEISAKDSVFLTTGACVAVARAIKELFDLDVQIKWINDIYCKGKKLCGILTQSALNCENQTLDFAVVGFGINFKKWKMPKEISNIAVSLEECVKLTHNRNELIASVVNHFENIYNSLPNKDFMNEYKNRSFIIGEKVTVLQASEQYNAIVKDINEDGNLIVEDEFKVLHTLCSGEVSLKLQN